VLADIGVRPGCVGALTAVKGFFEARLRGVGTVQLLSGGRELPLEFVAASGARSESGFELSDGLVARGAIPLGADGGVVGAAR